MAYKIRYGNLMKSRKTKIKMIPAVLSIVAALGIGSFFCSDSLPEPVRSFFQMFFPLMRPQVREALDCFREDVRDGVSFSDATEAFCISLLHEPDDG